MKSSTDFRDATADIARGIHRTSTSLSKLTKLVRKQGLFDDPTEEINNLIFAIKQDLDSLNSKCDVAQQFVDTKKRQLGSKNQLTSHNVTVVSQLKTELMNATKDFKSVLEMRSSKMKDQQQKKVQLTGVGTLSPMRQFTASAAAQAYQQQNLKHGEDSGPPRQLYGTSAFPMSPYSQIPPSDDTRNSHSSTSSTPQNFPVQQQYWQQQQLLLAPPATQQYFEAREQAVSEVEVTISELGKLYKRLATMISEQQELVERVDEDIENAVSNAEKAQNALLKTYESVSSNKGLYMKILAILTLFILFFVLFLM